MNLEDLNKLVDKYLQGKASLEEEMILLKYYKSLQGKSQVWQKTVLGDQDKVGEQLFIKISEDIDRKEANQKTRAVKKLWWQPISIAASILLIAGFGSYFLFKKERTSTLVQAKIDVAPGTTKATLTLEDGKTIELTDGAQEDLLPLTGLQVHKTEDGELFYAINKSLGTDESTPPTYHTITTPAGGIYQLRLPDGSKVWLNSMSSLRYPIPFPIDTRKVNLTGEGYFEIADARTENGKKTPFLVDASNQIVEVLGTHFNINAYNDEPSVRTTLLEGAIQLTQLNTNKKQVLKPGQQAVLSPNSFEVVFVNVENSIDWKNNSFTFQNDELKSIMREVARWYNVDVIYEGNFTPLHFTGSVSKSKNISNVLRIFQLTEKITYKIEDPINGDSRKRVIIMQ